MKICLSCEGVTDTQAHRCGHCDAPLVSADEVHYPARRGELDSGHPLLGTIIDGKYRLQSVLGRGGLGTVFRAQHVGSLITVAIKLLHPRFSERPEYRRALLPEARRAATVVHECCARLLDVGEGDEGIAYLAMELVEGQTLDEVMQQGPLAPSHAVELLVQVSAALSAVHEAGLVHCDLSPRNVMVTARFGRLEVKVLDFGIARSMNIAGRRHAQGEMLGFANPAFSAPELLSGAEVDARADIYSLGTLAWLMITGSMPVDDTDVEHAVAAVREGRLSPWPSGVGAPARLQRLIHRCLRFDVDDRPDSATDVERELVALRTGRGPRLARLAAIVSAVALVGTLAVSDAAPPAFLRPQPGSALQLSDRDLAEDTVVEDLRPEQLDTVVCHYAGFAPRRLRVEIARHGTVLTHVNLSPQVDEEAGTLLLSNAQASWREVVQGLVLASQEGPVDLAFVVPGSALVRAARVRVDNASPNVQARLKGEVSELRAESTLALELSDDIAVKKADVLVQLASGRSWSLPLPTTSGNYALGHELSVRVGEIGRLGAGRLIVSAADMAGNVTTLRPLSFDSADVGVPHVMAVTGPSGQSSVTQHGGLLRLRVRLSQMEPDCRLSFHSGDRPTAEVALPAVSSNEPTWHTLEVPATVVGEQTVSVEMYVTVVDAAGNEDRRLYLVSVVDRSPVLEIKKSSSPDSGSTLWTGSELVVDPSGGVVEVAVGPVYDVVAAHVEQLGQSLDQSLVTVRKGPNQGAEVVLGNLAAGVYTLFFSLLEGGSEQVAPLERSVRLRVLPAQIEVRVPSSNGRFLSQLIDAGVLSRRGNSITEGVGEGRGWRCEPELRSYIGGVLWLGDETWRIPQTKGFLLPGVTPVSGRNVMSVRLKDALERSVRLVDDLGNELEQTAGRQIFADFWWSDERPQLVGEEVLVEHGQPVRIRIRMPLPFMETDRSSLLLGYASGETRAIQVTSEGGGSIVAFDLPFTDWSAAARLSGRSREDFASGLNGTIEASITTPAGRDTQVALPVLTTRSTLSPMRLGDFTEVPQGLVSMQFLPVLGPSEAFVEPVPVNAPPRFTFRPQAPVDVRNMPDILLQDREVIWGEVRALSDFAKTITDVELVSACVHHADPLGASRLLPKNLLPSVGGRSQVSAAPDDSVVTGVDFFQAWAFSRLLGIAVDNKPDLFRLPLGCELELAAFGGAGGRSSHGVFAHGGAVSMSAFREEVAPLAPWTPELTRSLGDTVGTSYGISFVGLDFGVREWVLDLPHIRGIEMLLREWTSDHAVHLGRVMAISEGKSENGPDPLVLARQLGVVRGLAFGETSGVIDSEGSVVVLEQFNSLPPSVPGVLRSEQLRRDGLDLLNRGRDPRLAVVGFRFAADATQMSRLWGAR